MDDTQKKIKNLLVFISVILAFAALYVARDMFLPIVIGVLVALTFSPVVRALARLRIPEPVSAFVLILGAVLTLVFGTYMLSGPITEILDDAPSMGLELRQKLEGVAGMLEDAQDASEQVEGLANGGDSTPVVAVEQPSLLAFAAGSIANFLGLTVVGLVLALFILASGNLFYVKLLEAFPSFSDKRRAATTAREIERQISRYFLTITLINAGLGVSIGVAMYLIGLPNPILWGLLAFVLNFLPFVGAIVGAMVVAAFGILSFDTLGMGFLPAAVYLLLTSIEGQFVTPHVLGKRLELNTVSVFLTVIIWSWLWSVPGALMAVPFLVLLKAVCTNVPGLTVLGNFLGPRTVVQTTPRTADGTA
ncbi:Predicted PurR-regulated permease PerM [Cognatiyoonia koreensis]|uniref:Predicted PurR-regulated permease PerM n=1 Tax=Cognatiyoonia koreensis TaxID=364200 RepID=A0A1I0MIR4_9RHOB|nr:AI-2E family transporter [Cognatiyoonia koreensis]SEV88162.1 Predicted PurR-regulated permease PerM [Cognatiyoonia koreensis]